MNRFFLLPCALAGALWSSQIVTAQAASDYLGASAVLQQAAIAPKPADVNQPVPISVRALYKKELLAFKTTEATLPPQQAAQGWLNLVDKFYNARETANADGSSSPQPQFRDLLLALPPPAAWPTLVQLVEARPQNPRTTGLRLLAHVLTANLPAQAQDIATLHPPLQQSYDAQITREVIQQFGQLSGDPNYAVTNFEQALHRTHSDNYIEEILIPDLVKLGGPEKATTLIKSALLTPNITLSVYPGSETQVLVQTVALKMVAQLKEPQWGLVNSIAPTSIALYEAMQKRFPKDPQNSGSWRRDGAQSYYFMALIVAGRTAAATQFALHHSNDDSFRIDSFPPAQKAKDTQLVYEFLVKLQSQYPDQPYWDELTRLAAQLGHSEVPLVLARAAAARPGLSHNASVAARTHLYQTLLAADHVSEAVAVMQTLLEEKDTKVSWALIQLGQALNHPEWVDTGLNTLISHLTASNKSTEPSTDDDVLKVANFLTSVGRGPEAEALLAKDLKTATQNDQTQKVQNLENYYQTLQASDTDNRYMPDATERVYLESLNGTPRILFELVSVYYRTGRYADVVTVLDSAPGWGAVDLSKIIDITDDTGTPLGYIAASSLINLGRTDEARRVLKASLLVSNTFDPSYELLIKLDGQAAMPYFETLFQSDRFEKRPLIWKAHLLRLSGHLDEAEQTVRRAIAIDPSDGEQKHGQRFRAYTELADILEAKGDLAQAKTMRDAVQAIRIAEKADTLSEAGLLREAIQGYETALAQFSDAYCIQSRLAVRLAAQGNYAEAAVHYQRADELMPASFGRIESHCFGCEAIFDGQQAESISERVFEQIVKKTPRNPQVHYLLGYLRDFEGRYPEALTEFRTAVALDPDYLNAWQRLQDLQSNVPLTRKERDTIALNLLRLDPRVQHSSPQIYDIADLSGLWNTISANLALQPSMETVYPLAASTATREEIKTEIMNKEPSFFEMQNNDLYNETTLQAQVKSPALAVSQQLLVAAIGQYLQNTK